MLVGNIYRFRKCCYSNNDLARYLHCNLLRKVFPIIQSNQREEKKERKGSWRNSWVCPMAKLVCFTALTSGQWPPPPEWPSPPGTITHSSLTGWSLNHCTFPHHCQGSFGFNTGNANCPVPSGMYNFQLKCSHPKSQKYHALALGKIWAKQTSHSTKHAIQEIWASVHPGSLESRGRKPR